MSPMASAACISVRFPGPRRRRSSAQPSAETITANSDSRAGHRTPRSNLATCKQWPGKQQGIIGGIVLLIENAVSADRSKRQGRGECKPGDWRGQGCGGGSHNVGLVAACPRPASDGRCPPTGTLGPALPTSLPRLREHPIPAICPIPSVTAVLLAEGVTPTRHGGCPSMIARTQATFRAHRLNRLVLKLLLGKHLRGALLHGRRSGTSRTGCSQPEIGNNVVQWCHARAFYLSGKKNDALFAAGSGRGRREVGCREFSLSHERGWAK